MVTDNRSREVTDVSSLGPTCPGVYDTSTNQRIPLSDVPIHEKMAAVDLVKCEMLFEGDKLWWTQGVFEFRYHHGGNHNVMSISEPFEVRIGRFDEEDVGVDSNGVYEKAVESSLLPIVQNCLDRNPDIAPSTVDEPFGSLVERESKYARRVVYAIHHMFGIDFTPAIVPADGTVRKIAWRICNAKLVLVSRDLSPSQRL
jgi:phosphatidylethanolamine N-methyltransferase